MITFTAIGFAIFLCLLLDIVRRTIAYRRLRHVPGPFWASVSRIHLLRTLYAPEGFSWWLSEMQNKYGSPTRIGPNLVLHDDLDFYRRMYAPKSPFPRTDWYLVVKFDPHEENIASARDEALHNKLRSQCSSAYTSKEVPNLERSIDRQIQSLIDLIERKYISVDSVLKPIDMALTAQYLTVDVITDLVFGEAFGDLKRDEDVYGLIQLFKKSNDIFMVVSVWPVLYRVISMLKGLERIAPSLMKNPLEEIKGLAKEVVRRRFDEEKGDKQDVLGSFIRNGMNRERAVTEIVLQLLAGTDTTSTAIRATLLHIITSPQVYRKLQAEIDRADEQDLLSRPVITGSEAQKLSYLQACIKEGIRTWPPVTALAEKLTPPEGTHIGGTFIPGGTRIGTNIWAIQHKRAVFGQDADIFRPERWLEAEGDQLKDMEKHQSMSFASGRFSCLGKPVAMLELSKVFVELLRRYDLTIVNPANPWKSQDTSLWRQSDMFVKVTRRGGGRGGALKE